MKTQASNAKRLALLIALLMSLLLGSLAAWTPPGGGDSANKDATATPTPTPTPVGLVEQNSQLA